ncbi:hypothetical protein KTD13_16675 [Burkholderia multivorans]|uniref:hypothetical protein n=1 Tax=Burkholderia multivorans TaxID=87883 RepID=UPI001C21FA8C|nr:hypothetical protein [Burkholderia multivorans]MBU9261992.1 hypothetical protein [Burkholderia multivorans]
MLVGLLGDDELAPIYVIRLWAHCQNRKAWTFVLSAGALKGICRFSGDADLFERSMAECGFVTRDGEQIEVAGWAEYNASLIAAWSNGSKGGRPKKVKAEDSENLRDNPRETHGVTDKSREDKSREEKSVVNQGERGEKPSPSAKRTERTQTSRLPTDWQLPRSWGEWALAERPDWNADRVRKVADQFRDHWLSKGGADARKADWEATWRNWVRREKSLSGATNLQTGAAPLNRQEALEARNREIAARATAEMTEVMK